MQNSYEALYTVCPQCVFTFIFNAGNYSVSQEHGMHGLWQFVEFPNFFIGKDRNVI